MLPLPDVDLELAGSSFGLGHPLARRLELRLVAVAELSGRARSFLVVEMSAGQMVEDVRLAVGGATPVAFYGRTGGSVPSVEEVQAVVEAQLEGAS